MQPQDRAPAQKSAVERALDVLAHICIAVAGTALVVLVAIFGWLVWGRYVMNDTPTWVEQLALILVVWITFLGAAAGVWTKSHLSIDFVRETLPEPIRLPLHWMALAGMLVFGVVLAWQGWVLAESTWARRVPMLGVSEGIRAVPMAICGALTAIFTLYHGVALATGKD
ncbi:TRAP transporter small permease [Salipiger mucosus]|uniref:TRAP transporter small permease protein n=1 Tax=Salipiger mucosus DSM 16094 TaxID=1123237 RepID=S9RNF2_9RHOB|nr:TRAP transporter small permease [Salipiger mucosus]EPX75509.1 TRAP-type transport system, small permease component, predicted N-acetylneuraminate transporter [Salipiger mucosus DSM 16094]